MPLILIGAWNTHGTTTYQRGETWRTWLSCTLLTKGEVLS